MSKNYEHKPGQGTLWKNEKYIKGGNQPYAKGKVIDPSGNEWDAALWIPKSDKVKGFNITLSEKWKPKEKPQIEAKIEEPPMGEPVYKENLYDKGINADDDLTF